jgi:hypothetical protein
MQTIRNPLIAAALAIAACLAAAPQARSEDAFRFRALADVGAWGSSFRQSDNRDHSTRIATLIGPAIGFQMGGAFGILTLDYSFNWLIPSYLFRVPTDTAAGNVIRDARNAYYFAPFGLNAGLSFPLPIEPYAGIEKGWFGFSHGTGADYDATAVKAGVRFFFGPKVGLKAEFRRAFLGSDEAGDLPAGFSTRSDVYCVGITAGGR